MSFSASLHHCTQIIERNLRVFFLLLAVIGLIASFPPQAIAANLSPAPETARVYIIEPSDGQTVPEEFAVKFGLVGMGIAPAGMDKANTGHHHLLIDLDTDPDFTEPLPATANIRHFGGGQTETTLNLSPGKHTLQLLLGNYSHVPHDRPVLSKKIEITVE